MTFAGNKPYDVAHHFDRKFDRESNCDLFKVTRGHGKVKNEKLK
jgi:hypothetical protein